MDVQAGHSALTAQEGCGVLGGGSRDSLQWWTGLGAPAQCSSIGSTRVLGTPRTDGYLAVAANGLPALLTGVGIQVLEARHTEGALLPQDVLLAKERLVAMVAIKALSHFDAVLFNGPVKNGEISQVPVSTLHTARTQASQPPSLPLIFMQRLASSLCESLRRTP